MTYRTMKYTSNEGANEIFFTHFTKDNDGSTRDMNVNGSVTPQFFEVAAVGNVPRVISQVGYEMTDAKNWDPLEFGNLGAALSNGIRVTFRNTDLDTEIGDLTEGEPLTDNLDFYQYFPNTRYEDWGSGATDAILTGTNHLSETLAAPIVIMPNRALRVTIQDDLTGLSKFHWWVGGYYGVGINGRDGRT